MAPRLSPQWILGFVDGEGCFHVALHKNPQMALGVQVLPEFTVTQHVRDVAVLYALKSSFGCGVVRPQGDDVMCYRVRAHAHLRDIILPFFERHPLKTRKRQAFLRCRRVVLWMDRGLHLTPSGLTRIAQYVGGGSWRQSSKRGSGTWCEERVHPSMKVEGARERNSLSGEPWNLPD